ncbi:MULTISPECIES: SulP family inorganic anion transporter [Flavobacterium]|uniref:SulP family inorganic anion transporter n=1 Tax=Flavobacterium covae TaxID=2906076 RepID=A0ABW8PJX1_9FLAO|nr:MULTISPECIES: SulP family inorganic anion transporter [Flavobacterium]OXA81547.1 sulfate transporter [Flavobacterium columnare NBRC 100251 = ATCC 23463]AMA48492.1 sulfate transporter [Flavobacterium covae]MCJ1808754.1 SulP family inorganic anion transporter [Flavobacterium covae]OWP81495.1 sulfate transporter [Flavobacterium covae]POR22606.1 sulfate transporter [Flavobacterium columnare]
MNTKNKINIPTDGLAGLKENFSSDAISGFIVFLLALPLSLGIAKASDFPPIMGLITAIIGGILVSILSGSKLTIKGPAAGLIVIVAGSVAEFGKGDATLGWKLALGAMAVAGVVQILFGLLKLGKLADFFPLSAIHGMLAAIGIIIIAKQIPVLLNDDPTLAKGKKPLELLINIPNFIINLDPKATLIGIISLTIMMGWPFIKNTFIKKIPAPLVVLLFAIPAELFMDFKHTEPPFALVKIGNLVENLNINVDFSGISQTGLFIKYVIMFALVGTLESLLTVKAIDLLDPFKRKSNNNKDLIAVGVGNVLAAFLGGLPMIAEVARSSSNVNNGAKTRWANFFHGLFILLFLLVAAPILEMIPNAALAAMLITVGIKLAHPKEFIHTFEIGKEQLAIFLVTIFFTLFEDLLVGIGAGMLLNIIIHLYHGTPLSSFFKAPTEVLFEGNEYQINISKAAIFTNFLGIKRKLEEIPYGFNVTINLKETKMVDNSVLENLEHFKHDYEANGGKVNIVGLESHQAFSNHPNSSRKKITIC